MEGHSQGIGRSLPGASHWGKANPIHLKRYGRCKDMFNVLGHVQQFTAAFTRLYEYRLEVEAESPLLL